MIVKFSVDGINNINLLYTWIEEESEDFGRVETIEHYHGNEYCNNVVSDVLNTLSGWSTQEYAGSPGRIANETFSLSTEESREYTICFAINTYDRQTARIEVTIQTSESEIYDSKLEELKIALKDRLISDWHECTWMVDDQGTELCKEAFEKIYMIENNLRAFASKVLIHFLGVGWLNRAGLEKKAESVTEMKKNFVQRVPEFQNINADFLSLTLESLARIMFEGVIYKDDVILNREQFNKIQEIASRNSSVHAVADYIKARQSVDKNIWNDLFVPFIESPDQFKQMATAFINDRNHIAHSKVLSWRSYQVMLKDFQSMDSLIRSADEKFEHEEASNEIIHTWVADSEDVEAKREYYRERISIETGMDILSASEIEGWFDEVLHDLYSAVWQRYHLDVCFLISDFTEPSAGNTVFTVSIPAVEDESAKIEIAAEYSTDDDLSADSICRIIAKNGAEEEVCCAEVRFHNGNASECEDGLMQVEDNTEFDTSALDSFMIELFNAIDTLNPYPEELESLSYESKGSEHFVADFPCLQCGNLGISINETFLPIGRCCYCGYENELVQCARCGELFEANDTNNGCCPSCAAYIEEQ